jgi:DNA-binding CsgD family transcriptional regulator/PAS domain-containing protein
MSGDFGVDEVVSLIYRGATATWDPALSAMVDMFGASTVCLRLSMRGARPFELRFAAGSKIRREVLDEWEKTQRGIEISPTPKLGIPEIRRFVEDYPNDPVTKELLEFNVAFALAYCFESAGGTDYVLNVSRGINDPEFSLADIEAIKRIGKHFREAVRLRQELLRSNMTSQFQALVLDRLGIAGIMVDPYGNVLSLNLGAERMLASTSCLRLQRHNRLVAVNQAADSQLQTYIRKILGGTVPEGETFALSLERAEGGRPVGLLISSARTMCPASNREENCALLLLRDSETNFAIESALVQKLFSFTPAEANLAIGLASGQSLDEIEGHMRIRHNTARAHLRSIFVKADVTRQAELVSLLANSVAPLAQRARQPLVA